MSYLRFTPGEYGALSTTCQQLALAKMSFRTFQRVLVVSLATRLPKLAGRIAGLDEDTIRILYRHMEMRQRNQSRAVDPQKFTKKELRVVAETCGSFQSPI